MEQVKEGDKEFEQCHLEVLNFVKREDQDTLDTEEEAYDAHSSLVMEIRERLEQLEKVEESELSPTTATDPCGNLLRRLQ